MNRENSWNSKAKKMHRGEGKLRLLVSLYLFVTLFFLCQLQHARKWFWYDFAHLNELNKFDCVCPTHQTKKVRKHTKDIIISKTDCHINFTFDKFKRALNCPFCTAHHIVCWHYNEIKSPAFCSKSIEMV